MGTRLFYYTKFDTLLPLADVEEGNAKDLVDGNKDLQEKYKEGALSTTALEGDEKAKAEHKKDKKIKMVTRDKNLLLACSYFDLNHSGYIETKDTEDILLALNLNLSRAQVTYPILTNANPT